MNVTANKVGAALTLKVDGRLDTTTSPQFEEYIKDLSGVETLTLDLADLEYISSSGLRALLKAQKTMNNQGTMKLIHVNELVNEVFEITGFSDILTIE